MIGGGVSLRLADVSPQVAVPVMLYGEVRLVNVSTRHGGMFVTPVLIGVSIWSGDESHAHAPVAQRQ